MKREQGRALKKVCKAIDALIDVQDLGYGSEGISTALEILNRKASQLEQEAIQQGETV